MPLPALVEYLLSLQRPDNSGPLVAQGMQQIVVPAFPPNTNITLTSSTLGNDYVDMVYQAAWDPAMVPGAFHVWAQSYGNRAYDGVVTAMWLQNPVDTFIAITPAQNNYLYIQNLTPLNQYYAGLTIFLSIKSEADWQAVLDALRRVYTSSKMESLAAEANSLLSIIAQTPLPPVGMRGPK